MGKRYFSIWVRRGLVSLLGGVGGRFFMRDEDFMRKKLRKSVGETERESGLLETFQWTVYGER